MMNPKFLYFALMAGVLAAPATSPAQSLLEKIATVVLADQFGLDTGSVDAFGEQTNRSVYDLAPIYEGAHYFKREPRTIWQLRNEGLGWGQIAQRVGMNPGEFNKLRNQGAFDRDRFWTDSYSQRFNYPSDQIISMRRNGGSLQDVLGSVAVGRMNKKDPRQVYTRYRTDRSWTKVTNTYNVRFEDWRRTSRPGRAKYSGSSSGGHRDWSRDDDRDRGSKRSQARDRDRDRGKVRDKKQDKGKGKGSKKNKGGNGHGKGHSG